MRIIVITGEGRGKTTSALGLVLRAAGHGMRVCVVQFVKSECRTGEAVALRMLPGVELHILGDGFVREHSGKRFERHVECAEQALELVRCKIGVGYDVFVLDEICGALSLGLISLSTLLRLLDEAPEGSIFILTGRNAPAGLIERADTVSCIENLKHGCELGMAAQKGVEL